MTALINLSALAREAGNLSLARSLCAECLTLARPREDPAHVADAVEECAALAQAEGKPPRAARLAGAADRVREAFPEVRLGEEKATHEQTLAAARAALGEDAFSAAWEAGRAMTLDEAVEYALDGDHGAEPAAAPSSSAGCSTLSFTDPAGRNLLRSPPLSQRIGR